MEKKDFSYFVYSLFGKRKRRQHLLLHWHGGKTPPIECHSVPYVFKEFIECILYHKIDVVVTKNDISFFGGLLPISYKLLSVEERKFVERLYVERTTLFKMRYEYEGNHFTLSNFVYLIEYSTQHRREMVRDFLIIGTKMKHLTTFRRDAIAALQLIISSLVCPDSYVCTAHRILQRNGNIANLLCVD